jgi:hypothetical protein
MEATHAYAVGDCLARQPRRQKLPTGNDSMLALGEAGDHEIRMLMTFDPSRGPKVMSVGHTARMSAPDAQVTRSV